MALKVAYSQSYADRRHEREGMRKHFRKTPKHPQNEHDGAGKDEYLRDDGQRSGMHFKTLYG